MRLYLAPTFLLLSLSVLFSCGNDGSSGSDEQRQEDTTPYPTELTYDSELSSDEAEALKDSTNLMETLEIDGAQVRRFAQIFGGNNSSHVVQYFEDRVNYALSASTELESRISTSLTSNGYALLQNAEILASNPSVALWYLSEVNSPRSAQFRINDRDIPIQSSRIGIMQFGEPYSSLNPILQVMTLVHEARHSDCTGGALESDLVRFRNGQVPLNNSCGHLHVNCPSGHPYEGEPACDKHPWGAYVVGAIYSGGLSFACTSCSETQKSVAEAISLDSLSRLLYNFEDLMDGEFGPPNMSSSNQIKEE